MPASQRRTRDERIHTHNPAPAGAHVRAKLTSGLHHKQRTKGITADDCSREMMLDELCPAGSESDAPSKSLALNTLLLISGLE